MSAHSVMVPGDLFTVVSLARAVGRLSACMRLFASLCKLIIESETVNFRNIIYGLL